MRKRTEAVLTVTGLLAFLYIVTGLGLSLLPAVVVVIVPYLYGLYDGAVLID